MPWILLAFVTGVLLFVLLVGARQYERGGAAEALEQLAELRETLEDVDRRVRNLETIASETPLRPPESDASDGEIDNTTSEKKRKSRR